MKKILYNNLEIKSESDDSGCFFGYASVYYAL
jgi:hypothetical protein